MKTKLLTITLLSAFLITLAGCGGETTVSAPPESSAPSSTSTSAPAEETQPDEPSIIEYDNRPLCSNDKIDISLTSIAKDGVTYSITNKTSDILTVRDRGFALDGQCYYTGDYAYLYEDIVPNSTVEVTVPYELEDIEHETMSGAFEVNILDNKGFSSYEDFLPYSNINLGYSSNKIWFYPTDKQCGLDLYEDDLFTCRIYRIIEDTFAVTIKNNSTEHYQAMFDSLVINGTSITDTSTDNAELIPGCESILAVRALDRDLESELQEGDTIAGVIDLFGTDHGLSNKFSFNMTVE